MDKENESVDNLEQNPKEETAEILQIREDIEKEELRLAKLREEIAQSEKALDKRKEEIGDKPNKIQPKETFLKRGDIPEYDGEPIKITFYRDEMETEQLTVLNMIKHPMSWPTFFMMMIGVSLFLGGIMYAFGMVYDSIYTLYMFFLLLMVIGAFFTKVTRGLPQQLIEDEKIDVVKGRVIFFVLHSVLLGLLMQVMDRVLEDIRTTPISVVVMAMLVTAMSIHTIKPKGWVDEDDLFIG